MFIKTREPGIFELSLKQVIQIIEDNKKGKKPPSLEDFILKRRKIKLVLKMLLDRII